MQDVSGPAERPIFGPKSAANAKLELKTSQFMLIYIR